MTRYLIIGNEAGGIDPPISDDVLISSVATFGVAADVDQENRPSAPLLADQIVEAPARTPLASFEPPPLSSQLSGEHQCPTLVTPMTTGVGVGMVGVGVDGVLAVPAEAAGSLT